MIVFYKEIDFEGTPIGRIPKDWNVMKLKDVILEAKSGFACGRRDKNGILQLRMDSIDTEGWISTKGGVKVPLPDDVENYLLRPGDIIFNNTNSVDLIGKTAIFRGEFPRCVYSNHLTRIRVNSDRVVPEWILYLLIREWRLGIFKAVCHRHVHQAGINNNDILNLKIPVACASEQQKITEVLSTADEAIQKTSDVIAKTERLKKGLMQELLTKGIGHKEFKDSEVGRIPKEWGLIRLGDALILKNGERPQVVEDGRFLVYGANGVMGFSSNFLVDNEFTIVIGRVGAAGEVHLAKGKIWASDNTIYSGQYDRDRAYPPFIYYLLRFRHLAQFASKTTHPIIMQSFLKVFPIQLPTLEEQRKIAEILSTVDKKLEVERREKAELERVKQGMMDLLLTGRIRVKVS